MLEADKQSLSWAVDAVLAVHSVWGVYDCEDEQCSSECVSELMYVACQECCTVEGYQTEECATYHEDHTREPKNRCNTVAVIADALKTDDV